MKKYSRPDLEIVHFKLSDVICTSSDVESMSSYIAGPGDWGDDPIIDPDDDIIW